MCVAWGMNNLIVETHNLSFGFSISSPVLQDINLAIPPGSIYAFIGPNGAGKTTALKILLGLVRLKHQDIFLFGKALSSHRLEILKRTGSLIEQPSIYEHLSGERNLEIQRLIHHCPPERIDQVLAITGLIHARNQLTGTYSLGMKQRLGIAIALLHDPELLILDEPTNGLDPEGIIEIRNLILHLNREFRKTILISSHLLNEVEKIATHIGVISNGRLVFQGTSKDLETLRHDSSIFQLETTQTELALGILGKRHDVNKIDDSVLHISALNKDEIPSLIELLISHGIKIYGAQFLKNDLEEFYLKLLNK